ncbi:hypothetical protein [Piscirickettsia salmonis]|uniref:hypothetical protein n=1 Tax=Piscirickettsia salmonis TaxID=1238 RepID=UPI0012B9DDCA|nr:hypothetical protein [Piscirickettsia salmonis]
MVVSCILLKHCVAIDNEGAIKLLLILNSPSTFLSRSNIFIVNFERKRRYLGRYFAHPMMQNRRAKRDDYKPSAVRVTQRYVP